VSRRVQVSQVRQIRAAREAAYREREAVYVARARKALRSWYLGHIEAARVALLGHRCKLEIDIESARAAQLLQQRFPGTNASCWGKAARTAAASKKSNPRPPGKVLLSHNTARGPVRSPVRGPRLSARPRV